MMLSGVRPATSKSRTLAPAAVVRVLPEPMLRHRSKLAVPEKMHLSSSFALACAAVPCQPIRLATVGAKCQVWLHVAAPTKDMHNVRSGDEIKPPCATFCSCICWIWRCGASWMADRRWQAPPWALEFDNSIQHLSMLSVCYRHWGSKVDGAIKAYRLQRFRLPFAPGFSS